jgi:hypothetical protein
LGRLADPATATERPPRNGPISRHRSAAKLLLSYVVAEVGATEISLPEGARP